MFFSKFGVGWITRPMALLIFAGGIALLSTWMYGPARGFMRASFEGDFPHVFQGHNASLAPTSVLWIQAGIGSLFALLFLFEPTISASYWILSALTTQLLVIMYVLMFAAVIRLRYTQPDRPRPYKIPRRHARRLDHGRPRHRRLRLRLLCRFRSALADLDGQPHAVHLPDGLLHRLAGVPADLHLPVPQAILGGGRGDHGRGTGL